MVIPVLVNGAGMPKAADLPDSLKSFSFLNAAPVDVGRDFRPHVDRLVQSIDEVLARKSGKTSRAPLNPSTAAAPASKQTFSRMQIAALALVLLLAGGVATWQLKLRDTAGSAPTSTGAVTPPSDDAQWAQLKDTKDIGLLRRFIEQNPDSRHRAEAEQRVGALTMQSALSTALTSGDQAGSPDNDDDDWTQAKSADTFDAYQAYLKSHPQGGHVEEARRAAAEVRPIANALKEEPPIGQLLPGVSKIVDDHDPMCKRDEVKVVTGGDYVTKKVLRQRKCVPRDQFP
jgi:hypothetical protein